MHNQNDNLITLKYSDFHTALLLHCLSQHYLSPIDFYRKACEKLANCKQKARYLATLIKCNALHRNWLVSQMMNSLTGLLGAYIQVYKKKVLKEDPNTFGKVYNITKRCSYLDVLPKTYQNLNSCIGFLWDKISKNTLS